MKRLLGLLSLTLLVSLTSWAQDWQIHSNWCANVDRGSSHNAYMQTCAGNDQYTAVLNCQADAAKNNGDGGRAKNTIIAAGPAAINAYMESRKPAACRTSFPPPPPPIPTDEWKIHANWCANVDHGSSHNAYMNACTTADQYTAVLACQRDAAKNNGDGGRAVRAVTDAGPTAVNAYMNTVKPAACRPTATAPPPAPAPFYVIGRYQCKPSGSCDITVNSRASCSDAYTQFDKAIAQRGGDACRQCQLGTIDNSKSVLSGPEWKQLGPCPPR